MDVSFLLYFITIPFDWTCKQNLLEMAKHEADIGWIFADQRAKSVYVGLSMICYTLGKEKRMCFGEFQLSGRMGKLLYWRCLTASCFSKSAKSKNL